MKRLISISFLTIAALAVGAGAAQQQSVTTAALRGYLDKMGLRYVPHPKNADTLVVPRSENKNAERLDLYVEVRKDQSLVLTVYPKTERAVLHTGANDRPREAVSTIA